MASGRIRTEVLSATFTAGVRSVIFLFSQISFQILSAVCSGVRCSDAVNQILFLMLFLPEPSENGAGPRADPRRLPYVMFVTAQRGARGIQVADRVAVNFTSTSSTSTTYFQTHR